MVSSTLLVLIADDVDIARADKTPVLVFPVFGLRTF